MDPRLSLLIASHDQTHHDLEILTDDVRTNHQVLSDRIVRLEKELVSTGARITAEVGLIDRKLDDIERNAAIVKEHVLLMTGKFGELDKKFTLLEENVTARIDAVDEKLTSRIDAVDEKLTARIDDVEQKLTSRLDGIDARLDGIDARLDTIVDLLTTGPGNSRDNDAL